MNESTATLVVAFFTAVLGPVLVAWMSKLSKRTAKLQTFPEKQLIGVDHCKQVSEQMVVVMHSITLLHDKIDLLQDNKQLTDIINKIGRQP